MVSVILAYIIVCHYCLLCFVSQQRTTSGDTTQLSLAIPKTCPKPCSLSTQNPLLSSSQTLFSKSPQTGTHAGVQSLQELLLQRADSSLASQERPDRNSRSQSQVEKWAGTPWKQSQSGREGEEGGSCCAAQRK